MGCKKIQLEYFESLRTSQTNSMRLVNPIDKKNPYTYDACEFRENPFLTTKDTKITKKTQKPANYAKLSSLSCPQRKMQSLRTSQTINGLIPANYAKSTSIIKISILYYYGLRYYNSKLGRWINRAPIGEQGGLNLYVFVHNNPIDFWDYLGLTGDCCLSEKPVMHASGKIKYLDSIEENIDKDYKKYLKANKKDNADNVWGTQNQTTLGEEVTYNTLNQPKYFQYKYQVAIAYTGDKNNCTVKQTYEDQLNQGSNMGTQTDTLNDSWHPVYKDGYISVVDAPTWTTGSKGKIKFTIIFKSQASGSKYKECTIKYELKLDTINLNTTNATGIIPKYKEASIEVISNECK